MCRGQNITSGSWFQGWNSAHQPWPHVPAEPSCWPHGHAFYSALARGFPPAEVAAHAHQLLVYFVNEPVMENPQALISPHPYHLGHCLKPTGEDNVVGHQVLWGGRGLAGWGEHKSHIPISKLNTGATKSSPTAPPTTRKK